MRPRWPRHWRATQRERNSEYGERIEHQAATIDVLKAMSASPGDPQPVFDLIVRERAIYATARQRRCAEFDGDDAPSARDAGMRRSRRCADAYVAQFPLPPTRELVIGRAILERRIIHIRDLDADPDHVSHARSSDARVGDWRSHCCGTACRLGSSLMARLRARRLLRQPDRTAEDLRRAGGDRDHQRGDVSRVADPHERSSGIAGIPDRDQRRAEGHQPLDLRSATGAGYGGSRPPHGFAMPIRPRSFGARASLVRTGREFWISTGIRG